MRSNTTSKWLRNGDGGSKWAENRGKGRTPAIGSGEGNVVARFQETDGVVTETFGDNGRITIVAKNQGGKIWERKF